MNWHDPVDFEAGNHGNKPFLTIQEGYSGWWSSYRGSWGRGHGMSMSQNVSQAANEGGAASDSPLAPGTIRVSASVTVTFDLQ